jgi:hypothetical protein
MIAYGKIKENITDPTEEVGIEKRHLAPEWAGGPEKFDWLK